MDRTTNSKDYLPRILVIDDERGIRESIRYSLCSVGMMSTAESVEEGLRYLQLQKVDLIILDLRLPGMNGIEGLKEIRKLDSDVAVVILTACGSLESAQEALRMGATDYQLKPFDVKALVKTAERNIKKTFDNRKRTVAVDHVSTLCKSTSDPSHHLTFKDVSAPLKSIDRQVQMIRDNLLNYGHDPHSFKDTVVARLNVLNDSLRLSKEMLASMERSYKHGASYEVVNLSSIIYDVDLLLQPSCDMYQATVVTGVADPELAILGNRLLILRVLFNIAQFMIDKAEHETSALRLFSEQMNQAAVCTITFEGICDEVLVSRIKESLADAFAGDSSVLSSTAGIITAHGGDYTIGHHKCQLVCRLSFPAYETVGTCINC